MDHAEVVHTLVFAASPQGGNPCPVVPDADGMDDTTMQALARRFGLDTVFIMEPSAKTADVRLRYFVPDHEMGVSGHATVAAITVALKRGLRPQHARVETTSGLFEFGWLRKNGGYVVTFEQNSPVFGPTISGAQVAPVLKIGIDDIASNESPIQAVSVSRPKLIVPIRDWGQVATSGCSTRGCPAEDLVRVHHIRTTKGEPHSHSLWEMQHLISHGSYHRGQVTTMLRQLNAKPVATDLILFHRQRSAR